MAKVEIVDNVWCWQGCEAMGFPLQAGRNHCVVSEPSQNRNHKGNMFIKTFYVASF